MMNPDGYVAYIKSFNSKLGDAVNSALEINNPAIAQIKVLSLYPSKLIAEAACAGFEMNLPEEVAIAYLVIAEGMRFEKSNSRLSLALSPSTREKHNTHLALARFVDPVIQPYKGTKLFNDFIERLAQGMSQTNR